MANKPPRQPKRRKKTNADIKRDRLKQIKEKKSMPASVPNGAKNDIWAPATAQYATCGNLIAAASQTLHVVSDKNILGLLTSEERSRVKTLATTLSADIQQAHTELERLYLTHKDKTGETHSEESFEAFYVYETYVTWIDGFTNTVINGTAKDLSAIIENAIARGKTNDHAEPAV